MALFERISVRKQILFT